ncbi:hypothetical protein GCM10022292_05330 [Winogradskyella damuponensis]|uniref:Uncharacterized protein n=1 Tax=Winogradskyella damuponensis TaxID=943939 RepID=A0ABP8CNB3_9FLAO
METRVGDLSEDDFSVDGVSVLIVCGMLLSTFLVVLLQLKINNKKFIATKKDKISVIVRIILFSC